MPKRSSNVRYFATVLSNTKYLRIKWWIYLPVYVYRGMLRWRGKCDPNEPMFPEWMTLDEIRAICHKMYEKNILI